MERCLSVQVNLLPSRVEYIQVSDISFFWTDEVVVVLHGKVPIAKKRRPFWRTPVAHWSALINKHRAMLQLVGVGNKDWLSMFSMLQLLWRIFSIFSSIYSNKFLASAFRIVQKLQLVGRNSVHFYSPSATFQMMNGLFQRSFKMAWYTVQHLLNKCWSFC